MFPNRPCGSFVFEENAPVSYAFSNNMLTNASDCWRRQHINSHHFQLFGLHKSFVFAGGWQSSFCHMDDI